MVSKVGTSGVNLAQLEADLRALQADRKQEKLNTTDAAKPGGFADMLAKGISDVNQGVKQAEQASMDLASGKSSNLHEAMLAATKAELGFNLMVQLRNKALEAYQEVMRMQV